MFTSFLNNFMFNDHYKFHLIFIYFYFFKIKQDFALYPELIVNHKLKKGQKDFWPLETQTWMISKVCLIKVQHML